MNDAKQALQVLDSQTPAQNSSSAILAVITRAAADSAVDVEKMERLLAMHERIVARDAEAAFNTAMREAQEKMPRVKKNARNSHTNSTYANLETLNKAIVPVYSAHGFSLSYGSVDCPIPEHRRITCRVAHTGGHSRDYFLDLPLDTAGSKGTANKPPIQGFGSTITYGRRYLAMMIFNVATSDDDDGNGGGEAKSVTELSKQLWEACRPIRGTAQNWDLALKWLREVCDMPAEKRIKDLTAEELTELIRLAKERMPQ